MRLLQAHRHSAQHVASTHHVAHPQSEPSAQSGPDRAATRHGAQLITASTVPADPYAAWLEQREAEREREERSLNPRDVWDNLRTLTHC
jgi:hypothetical protein